MLPWAACINRMLGNLKAFGFLGHTVLDTPAGVPAAPGPTGSLSLLAQQRQRHQQWMQSMAVGPAMAGRGSVGATPPCVAGPGATTARQDAPNSSERESLAASPGAHQGATEMRPILATGHHNKVPTAATPLMAPPMVGPYPYPPTMVASMSGPVVVQWPHPHLMQLPPQMHPSQHEADTGAQRHHLQQRHETVSHGCASAAPPQPQERGRTAQTSQSPVISIDPTSRPAPGPAIRPMGAMVSSPHGGSSQIVPIKQQCEGIVKILLGKCSRKPIHCCLHAQLSTECLSALNVT